MIFSCESPCIVCAPGVGGGIGPVDPTNPFLNLSSEAPDVDNFIARYNTPGLPPLGQFFFAVGCVSFCLSDESQAEADLCAARQNVLCSAVNWPITTINPGFPGPGQPPTLHFNRNTFGNVETTCTYECPGGTLNTYTVPAGTFLAFNQATANAQAFSYCQTRVSQTSVCLTLASDRICFGQQSNAIIVSTSPLDAVQIVAGALPDGLSMSFNTFLITLSGTPTVGGDFNFTISALDINGTQVTQSFTLQVFGITNDATLAAATVGTPYLLQLNLDGTPDGVFQYAVVGGALPDGLTLNPTSGIISGTPTTDADFSFTVKVADASIECLRDFTIPKDSCNIVWTNIVWTPTTIPSGDGSATITFPGNMPSFSVKGGSGISYAGGTGELTYCGGPYDCRLDLTIDSLTNTSFRIRIAHYVTGILIDINVDSFNPNASPYLFTVPASTPGFGSMIQVIGITLPPNFVECNDPALVSGSFTITKV